MRLTGSSSPLFVTLGDVNGDDNLDTVTVQNDPQLGPRAVVYLGAGTGGFALPVTYAVAAIPQSLTLADLDGDGDPDIATANSTSNSATVLLNDGKGGFGSPRVPGGPQAVAIRAVAGA